MKRETVTRAINPDNLIQMDKRDVDQMLLRLKQAEALLKRFTKAGTLDEFMTLTNDILGFINPPKESEEQPHGDPPGCRACPPDTNKPEDEDG